MSNEYLAQKRADADTLKATIDAIDTSNCLGGLNTDVVFKKVELSLLYECLVMLIEIKEGLNE